VEQVGRLLLGRLAAAVVARGDPPERGQALRDACAEVGVSSCSYIPSEPSDRQVVCVTGENEQSFRSKPYSDFG